MRRFVAALILLVIVLGVCIFSNHKLDVMMQDLSIHVQESETLVQAGRTEDALTVLTDSYNVWRHNQTMLGVIVHHNEIDELEINYVRATEYLQNGEKSEYFVESAQLRDMMEHLVDFTRFKVANVF